MQVNTHTATLFLQPFTLPSLQHLEQPQCPPPTSFSQQQMEIQQQPIQQNPHLNDQQTTESITHPYNNEKNEKLVEKERHDHRINKLVNVFMIECAQTNPESKTIVSCLNTMCLMLYKIHTDKQAVKPILNLKFVNCLLNLDVQSLITLNQNIQSSLCLLLKILLSHNFFKRNETHRLFQLFKQFSLQLFTQISNNPRVIFNTFKIIQQLQLKNVITPVEYKKCKLMERIKEKMTGVEIEASAIYQLGYKLLMGDGDGVYEAYGVYKKMVENRKLAGMEAFFIVLKQRKEHLPQSIFEEIFRQNIFNPTKPIQPSFYSFLCDKITQLDIVSFTHLIQGEMIQSLAGKWSVIVYYNQVKMLVDVANCIKRRVHNTILEEDVCDLINCEFQEVIRGRGKKEVRQ